MSFKAFFLLHRVEMPSEVYFHLQLLVIQHLQNQQTILVHFTWSCGRQREQLLHNSCLNVPVSAHNGLEPFQEKSNCVSAKECLGQVVEVKVAQSNKLLIPSR